jgi:hypothetical protein
VRDDVGEAANFVGSLLIEQLELERVILGIRYEEREALLPFYCEWKLIKNSLQF